MAKALVIADRGVVFPPDALCTCDVTSLFVSGVYDLFPSLTPCDGLSFSVELIQQVPQAGQCFWDNSAQVNLPPNEDVCLSDATCTTPYVVWTLPVFRVTPFSSEFDRIVRLGLPLPPNSGDPNFCPTPGNYLLGEVGGAGFTLCRDCAIPGFGTCPGTVQVTLTL